MNLIWGFIGFMFFLVVLSCIAGFIVGFYLPNTGNTKTNKTKDSPFDDDDDDDDDEPNTGFFSDDYSSSDSFSYDDEYEPVTDITDPQCLDDSEPWDWTF